MKQYLVALGFSAATVLFLACVLDASSSAPPGYIGAGSPPDAGCFTDALSVVDDACYVQMSSATMCNGCPCAWTVVLPCVVADDSGLTEGGWDCLGLCGLQYPSAAWGSQCGFWSNISCALTTSDAGGVAFSATCNVCDMKD